MLDVSCLTKRVNRQRNHEQSARAVDKGIDRVLKELGDAELLIRQDGGFYWMHSSVRNRIYEECMRQEPQGMANLHELIAHYYYEMVYRPSRDIQALFEFFFHQVCAIREASAEARLGRLTALEHALKRERTHLLTRRHCGALLEWIHEFETTTLPTR